MYTPNLLSRFQREVYWSRTHPGIGLVETYECKKIGVPKLWRATRQKKY